LNGKIFIKFLTRFYTEHFDGVVNANSKHPIAVHPRALVYNANCAISDIGQVAVCGKVGKASERADAGAQSFKFPPSKRAKAAEG